MGLLQFGRLIVYVAVSFIQFEYCYSQPAKYSQEEADRMTMTYAYSLIQLNSIEAISLKFPQLAVLAQEALREWNNAFLPSIKNIDDELIRTMQKEWEDKRDLMALKYSRADYSLVKENDAREYIFEVNRRAIGKIETPVLETLLVFKPEYQKMPLQEYMDGYINKFYSKDIKNSKGLHLMLYYPTSWKSVAGDAKSAYTHMFVSKFGQGNLSASLIIETNKSDASKGKSTPYLSKENLIKGIAKPEQVLEYKPKLIIDNCPAAKIVMYYEVNQPNQVVAYWNETYALSYKNYAVKLSFAYTAPSGKKEDIIADLEKYNIIVRRMKDSLVILSQWEQKRK